MPIEKLDALDDELLAEIAKIKGQPAQKAVPRPACEIYPLSAAEKTKVEAWLKAEKEALENPASGQKMPDGTVYLNLNAMNDSRSNPASAATGKYDLETVAMHEIDEVLGLGSTLGQGFPGPYNTYMSPEDLFRYDASGKRTFLP